ncbi:glycoside hydrolase family 3 N-terminal domain-containing protein [Paenibacillus polymyxa]|uniref:glycoside hydrolase family 3 N-terminal domain-containing protein n=1 Tax=Paenibacillus polymyxa TaxID=1406 RepID=UPI003D26FA66
MNEFRYKDITLSSEERAKDLIHRMSIEEKVAQLQCYNPKDKNGPNLENSFHYGVGAIAFLAAAWDDSKEMVADKLRDYQKKVMERSRFDIPALFHIEGLTGALMPEATSFPTGIGRGSAWDPELEYEAGKIIGKEMSAVGIKHALAPVLDVTRDARLGRQGESYGEDPTLVSALGTSYVVGIQNSGDNDEYNIMATSKHFIGYHAGQGGIHAAATNVPDRELQEIFGKPFQSAISKGNLRSVMNQYGSVNGEPVAASKYLLQDLLRKEMGFDGLLVADYASIEELFTRMKVCEGKNEAAVKALNAGFDLELPTPSAYGDNLIQLLEEGKINIQLLDETVLRVLTEKFRLGIFENPFPSSYEKIEEVFNKEESKKISLKYARESLILLKNNGILPLDAADKKIAIIGHNARSTRSLFGGYSYGSVLELAMGARNTMAGIEVQTDDVLWRNKKKDTYPGSIIDVEIPKLEQVASKAYKHCRNILEQFKQCCPNSDIQYQYGYPYVGNDTRHHEDALKLAKESDVTIVTVGGKYGWGTSCSTGEGIDSSSINLPQCQEEFLVKLGESGIPFIVVHLDGRPISSDAADKYASAIIEAWNPGEFGSQAIVETILGANNPSGKLPVSVAYSSAQAPLYYNHSQGSSYHVQTGSPFTRYIDLPHTPRYYFGYGLSYTTFDYHNLQTEKSKIKPFEKIHISFEVENSGDTAGVEIAQIYVCDKVASLVRPAQELVGFCRIPLEAKQKKKVDFYIDPSQLAFLDEDMKWKIEAGEFDVMIGSSSEDIRLKTNVSILEDGYTQSKNREYYASYKISE